MRRLLFGLLRTLGIALYWAGLGRAVIWLRRKHPRVLVYHSCLPGESDFVEGLGTNLHPSTFEVHLEVISRYYNTGTIEDLESGAVPDRFVAITFDDGYRSIYDHALPRLRHHGMTASVYLVTGAIGDRGLMWPNEVCWFMTRFRDSTLMQIEDHFGGLPRDASPFDAVNFLSERNEEGEVDALLASLRQRHGDPRHLVAGDAGLFLSWDQIRELSEVGFTFGSHTHTHPNCDRISPDAFREEVMTSRNEILQRLQTVSSFAFPFGVGGSDKRQLLPDHGFRSVMMLEETGNRPLDLLRVSRTGTEARSRAAFFADLEVVAPVRMLLRRVRDRVGRAP